jgi:hypothetical protein
VYRKRTGWKPFGLVPPAAKVEAVSGIALTTFVRILLIGSFGILAILTLFLKNEPNSKIASVRKKALEKWSPLHCHGYIIMAKEDGSLKKHTKLFLFLLFVALGFLFGFIPIKPGL